MFLLGVLIRVSVICVNRCSVCCWTHPLLGSQFLLWFGGLRFSRKWGSLSGQGRVNIVDRLVRRTLVVGPCCCLLCWKAEKSLDHLFWDCQYVWAMWSYFLQEFGVNYVGYWSICAMIEEFLLHLPLRERVFFCCLLGCVLLFGMFGERRTIRFFVVG